MIMYDQMERAWKDGVVLSNNFRGQTEKNNGNICVTVRLPSDWDSNQGFIEWNSVYLTTRYTVSHDGTITHNAGLEEDVVLLFQHLDLDSLSVGRDSNPGTLEDDTGVVITIPRPFIQQHEPLIHILRRCCP
jgi:hypothetical protein